MNARLVLPLLLAALALGCLSAETRDAEPPPGPVPLPFHVAVLAPTEEIAAARALAEALARETFVLAGVASDLAEVEALGADLVLVARAKGSAGAEPLEAGTGAEEPTAAAPIPVALALYAAPFLQTEGDAPRGEYGKLLELRLDLVPAVAEEARWAVLGDALATALDAHRDALARGTLVPVGLDAAVLEVTRTPIGTSVRGALRFAPESRTRRLRSVRLTLAGAEPVEARLVEVTPGSELRPFEAELPPTEPGARIGVEAVVGSRVRLTRTFTLVVP